MTCRVGDPYEESPLPDLTIGEAENAYIAWRAAQPLLARAGVPADRNAYILGGGPPALALRDVARTLRATALVAGRGTPRPRVLRYLAGDTAPALARAFPTPVLFVDDAPLALDDGPILCVLASEPETWEPQLHAAATFAGRSGAALAIHAMTPSPDAPPVRTPVAPEPLPADADPVAAIATLAERSRPTLVVVGQPETSALRAFARGSLPVDLLARCATPIMTCPTR